MNWYQKVEDYVKKVFTKCGKESSIKHFIRTVYWIKKLRPDSDEALLIAGVAHDIERSVRTQKEYDKLKNTGFLDKKFLKKHQEKSAKIIGEFLEKEGASSKLIERVKSLVSHHEVGGDDDQNLLMDADIISFFENNAERWVYNNVEIYGKDIIKEKFDWMFNKISTKERKNICKPMYEKVIEMLNES